MRRAPVAALVGLIMIGAPFVAAAANHGGEQAAIAPTVVTFLDPLVNLPAIVVELDFMMEAGKKVKHSPSSDDDPMKFAARPGGSVGAHLRIEAAGTDLDLELAALIEFAKSPPRNNAPPRVDLVWGHLGFRTVELQGLNSSSLNITHDANKGDYADLHLTITDAQEPQVARDLQFLQPAVGVAVWVLGFKFAPTPNWTRHREAHDDAPELEFSDGQARSMTFELFFDGYEQQSEIRTAVTNLADHAFDSPSKDATRPIDFLWGRDLVFRGFVTHVDIRHSLFLPDGQPTRATVTLGLAGVHRPHGNSHGIHYGQDPPPSLTFAPQISFLDPELESPAALIAMDVWFNHSNDSHDMAVDWQRHRNADSPPPEFKAPEAMNLSIELLFDTYEERTDLKGALEPLLNFPAIADKEKRPPLVTFTWGNKMPQFSGVIESLGVKYTLFADNGTPVRATVNLQMHNASKLTMREAEAHGSDHNGTTTSAEGNTTYTPGHPQSANITLIGWMTPGRSPMMDWFFDLVNATGSALDMKFTFWLPEPSAGAWDCTQVTFTPPQFGPKGPEPPKITVRADVLGLKKGEIPTFSTELAKQVCIIDHTGNSTGDGGHHRERPDEFQKATGFSVDINGTRSRADMFLGGAIRVPLNQDPIRPVHHSLGQVEWGDIELKRGTVDGANESDWQEWYNNSRKQPDRSPFTLTFVCTGSAGEVLAGWNFLGAYPTKWNASDLDSDQSGMAIERINISVEKVERS